MNTSIHVEVSGEGQDVEAMFVADLHRDFIVGAHADKRCDFQAESRIPAVMRTHALLVHEYIGDGIDAVKPQKQSLVLPLLSDVQVTDVDGRRTGIVHLPFGNLSGIPGMRQGDDGIFEFLPDVV